MKKIRNVKSEVRSGAEARNPRADFARRRIIALRFSRFGFRIAVLAAVLARLASLAPAAVPAPETAFQEASAAYARGAYSDSAVRWSDLAREHPSAGAFHNLGNAEWKRGRVGYAILAWERAQWLDPFDANTRANLRFARKNAQLGAPDLAWYEVCSTWLPVDAWAWIASGGFWVAVGLVALPGIFRWRKAGWHQAVSAAGFALFLLAAPALLGIQTRAELGVIRLADTPLRLTPTSEAQALARLPAGEVVRWERSRRDYLYVRAGNDAAGWVRRSEFGAISSE